MGSNPSKSSENRKQTIHTTSRKNDRPDERQQSPEPEIDDAHREIHKQNLKKLKSTIKHLKNDKRKQTNDRYLESYASWVVETAQVYFSTNIENDKLRLELSRELATSGAVAVLCDLAVDLYNIGFYDADGNMDETNFTVLESSLSALTNFSDADQEDTPIICDHPKFLESTANYLTKLKDTAENDEEKVELIDAILSIIHNVAMFDNNVFKVRSFNYVKVLTPYLDSSIKNARLIAIAGMADIVNEEESEILQKGQNVLAFLMKVLKTAMASDNRMHPWLSWPVWELSRAGWTKTMSIHGHIATMKSGVKTHCCALLLLVIWPRGSKLQSALCLIIKLAKANPVMRKIARNDTNKKALVDLGFLPLLVEIAGSKDLREQRESIGTLRTLSFDEDIQKTMISDTSLGVIDIFVANRESADAKIAKSSNGALWTMREELSKSDKYKQLDIVKAFAAHQAKQQEDFETNKRAKGHVMVSYQWSNQQLLIKVRDHLRTNGFKVWMDIDDMAGSTLEAMARAVEEAEVVLVCYSMKYKVSDNCRAEAEYAFEKRKPIIPLRMEQGYKADGWLGIIIGAKKFYDFSGKYTFDSRTEDLVKELRGKFSGFQEIVPQQSLQVSHQPMELMPSNEVFSSTHTDVRVWTSLQVTQWLDKHGLDRSKFGKLHGVEIAYLQFLLDKSPDYFNKALIEQLKIKDLFTMAKFTFALADTNI